MKGYSFRSLTDLVLKIFKTKVNAGTGLSGGGSLEADRTLSVKYGTTAGTATQGDDSRLSNNREWTAATIGQAEAEVGTATTRRAFTAQRVRQAIVAWWNSATGVFGRDLVTSTNNTAARDKLGLFTSALRWPTWEEVSGKPTTFTLSSHTHPWSQVTDKPTTATRWPSLAEVTGTPANYPTNWASVSDKPVVQSVGTSTTSLMSQKAVTDALRSAGTSGTPDKNNILFSGTTKAKIEFDHIQCSGNSVVTEYASPYSFSSFMYMGGFSCKNTKSGSNYVHYLPHGISVGGSVTPNIMEFTSFNYSSPNSVEFKGTVHVNKGIFATESIGTSSFMHMSSLQIRKTNNSIVAQVDNNGVASFVDVNITSDERYKSNKTKIASPIDKVNALSGYNYTLHSEIGGDVVGKSVGILAQDVEKVMPECVTDTDGKLSVSYSGITALLVEAVKDLNARIIELEKTIEMTR